MADNTTINTGSGGDVISTDDIGGVKVQRVKVQYGSDGSATDVSSTAPMPVVESTLANFHLNDLDEGTTSYYGYTKPDGTWLVKELTDTTLGYATITNNGAVTTYADAWAATASLTYGRMDEAF